MSATASTTASSACSSTFASPLDFCAQGRFLPPNPALAKALEADELLKHAVVRSAGHSRSTSASSAAMLGMLKGVDATSEQGEESPSEQGHELDEAMEGLCFVVQKTFIDCPIPRSPSLETFFVERTVRSCPATRAPSVESRPTSTFASEDVSSECLQRLVLRLDEVVKRPELGSQEMPTVGSANHRVGTCKPCAFAHTKGCQNGIDCQFCHLCIPNEKKRRQKQRIQSDRRTMLATSPVHSSPVAERSPIASPVRSMGSPAATVDQRFMPVVSPMAGAMLQVPSYSFC